MSLRLENVFSWFLNNFSAHVVLWSTLKVTFRKKLWIEISTSSWHSSVSTCVMNSLSWTHVMKIANIPPRLVLFLFLSDICWTNLTQGQKELILDFTVLLKKEAPLKIDFKKDKLWVVFLVIIQTNVTLCIWAAIKGQKLSQHNNNNNNNNSSPWPRILEKYNSRIWLESTFVDVWIKTISVMLSDWPGQEMYLLL